ncbi:hypothetical protein ACWDFR_42780 [Streptomyces sp. 900105755]
MNPATTDTAAPWLRGPRFEVGIQQPFPPDEWTWRTLPPDHPALAGSPGALRKSDPGNALAIVAEAYGKPTSYCVLGGNVASVSNWEGISFDQQYAASTHGAGVYPCGGMYYLSVEGPGAADVLDLLTPRDIGALDIGQAAFAIFTTPEGTVDTEGIVLRTGPVSFQVSIGGSARPPDWLYDAVALHPGARTAEAALSSFNIKGAQRTRAMARLVSEPFADGLARLPRFRAIPVRTRWGDDAWVVRTVIGIEMWAAPHTVETAWQTMVAAPDLYTPCGWDVLATYRLECSQFAFYLCPLDIHRGIPLADAGLSHVVSREKTTPYVGRRALTDRTAKTDTARMWVCGLTARDRAAPRRRIGERVLASGSAQAIGYVTTAGHSPLAGRELCFAHLPATVLPGDEVAFEDGTAWLVSGLPHRPAAVNA